MKIIKTIALALALTLLPLGGSPQAVVEPVMFKYDKAEARELKPEILALFLTLREAYEGYEVYITAMTKGAHAPDSKHYSGNAIDVRTKHLPWDRKYLVKMYIEHVAGPDYDVFLEDLNGPNEHLHIEYDPKG